MPALNKIAMLGAVCPLMASCSLLLLPSCWDRKIGWLQSPVLSIMFLTCLVIPFQGWSLVHARAQLCHWVCPTPPPATSCFLLASWEYHGPVLYFTVWSLVYGLLRFLSELQKSLSCYTSLSAPGKDLQAEAQLDTSPLETSTAVLLLQDGSSFVGTGPSQIPCCWSGHPRAMLYC